ncbi:unnamed protein product [Urochloa humidicola]
MSPSSIYMLLIAFVVVAPCIPTSAASRDGGAAKDAAAPAPSASGESLHPMDLIDDIIRGIVHFHLPDLPVPAILPCPPAFPIKIPLIPCYNYTPQPQPPPVTECRPSIVKFLPACARFLTGGGDVSSPPRKCCDIVHPLFMDSLCYCHIFNGDANKLLPAPVNQSRALKLLQHCGYDGITSDDITYICEHGKEEDEVPPMDSASPPPRRH